MTELFRDGFEDGLWTHRVKVFPVGAESYETEVGNIFTPKGWLFYFAHDPGTWDQPEARHCWRSADSNRIKEGDGAHMFFSCWRCHDAGYMRQVTVTPGTKLRFTAWAHAWSNHGLEGHESCLDDGRCSCGVGRQVVAIAAEDIPALTGDPWNDAVGNSIFVVGIDPTGGTDPFSSSVKWGPVFCIYNGYAKELEVEVVAQALTVTIFMRNMTLYKFKHNDSYWDEAKLEAIEGEGRGKPRIQYERTYVLLPPDAEQEWAHAVVSATWNDHRYTVGGSADDAGIGDLDYRRVIAVNPAGWGDGLEVFFEDYYLGVEYVPIEAETPEILQQILTGDEDIALSQNDPRWANKDLGEDPGGETIGDAGCLLTGYAICLRHAGHWIYPDQLNTILADAGTPFTSDDLLTNWPAAVGLFSEFDSSLKNNNQYGPASLTELLAEGWEVILRRADGKHFLYLERVDGATLHIIDPWDGLRKTKAASAYMGIRAAHRTDATPPPPPPPPPEEGTFVSLHVQSLVDGIMAFMLSNPQTHRFGLSQGAQQTLQEYIAYYQEALEAAMGFVLRYKPRVIKIFQLEHAERIKALSPDTTVVLRYYTPDQDLGGDIRASMRDYVRSFQPSLETNYKWINYVEGWNELVCSNNKSSIQRAVESDYWFAEELMALELPGIAPQLLNVAVGNPLESEVELLLPAVRQVIKYDGTIGYHGYGQAVNGSNLNDAWEHLAGRALEGWDPVFRAHGLYPKYVMGECGAFATCSDGWRAANCLNGDWPLYLAQLREFSDRIKAWNTQHSNRCLGGTLFTVGGWGWDSFEIRKAQMEDPNWPM